MSHAEALETWLVRVTGRVQGVGYRWSCVRQARQQGVAGWVRNRQDGSVEALLQADPARLARFADWMREEVESALVEELTVQVIEPPFARLEGFEQRPTA